MTAPAAKRNRNPAKPLDPDTLARLRAQVGLPPEGPTPAMAKDWHDEEPVPDSPVDEQPETDETAELRDALDRERARHVQTSAALDASRRVCDQLRAENADLKASWQAEVDRLAHVERERDRAHADALRAIGALEAARRERDNYAEQLQQRANDNIELLRQAETWEAEYERVRDEKLTDLADQIETRHRHAWEWQPALKPMPLPCSCGQPWPLDRPPDLAAVVPHRQRKGSTR